MKIYIVMYFYPCECETTCRCAEPSIHGVYSTKEKAEAIAKNLYQHFVREYDVE